MRKMGFPGMGMPGGMNMNKLLKEAQKMQSNIQVQKDELEKQVFETTSGGGAIKATMNGKKQLLSIDIKEEVIDKDDKEMLQDLIMVTVNDLISKVDQEEQKITEGLNIPGL